MSLFANQLEDLKRSQNLLDRFKQKGVTEAAGDIEKFQRKLTHFLKKFTKAQDGDEDERNDVVEDYENLEYNESEDQKFTLKIRSIIEKYIVEYHAEHFDVITEEKWNSLLADGLTNVQIKAQDQREKQKIDQTLSKYTMEKNKCLTSNKQQELRIVLIGKPGVGKSATGNTLLGGKEFAVSNIQKSVTEVIKLKEMTDADGRKITIIDTPAILNNVNDVNEFEIAKVISEFSEGVHAFVLVRNASHYQLTEEEIKTIEVLKRIFGAHVMQHCVLLLTHADAKFKTEPLSSWIEEMENGKLKEIIQQVNERVVGVNNSCKTEYERTLHRNNIIQIVDKVQENVRGKVCTNELFRKAKGHRAEIERSREHDRQVKQRKLADALETIKKLSKFEADQALKPATKENIKRLDLSKITADILEIARNKLSSIPSEINLPWYFRVWPWLLHFLLQGGYCRIESALTWIEGFPEGSSMVADLVEDCVRLQCQIKEVALKNLAAADAKRKCAAITEQYISDNLSTMENTSVTTIVNYVSLHLERNVILALGSVQQEQVQIPTENMYREGLKQLTQEVENIKSSSDKPNRIQNSLNRATKELNDKVREKVGILVMEKTKDQLHNVAVDAIFGQVRPALSIEAKKYLSADAIKSNINDCINKHRAVLTILAKRINQRRIQTTPF